MSVRVRPTVRDTSLGRTDWIVVPGISEGSGFRSLERSTIEVGDLLLRERRKLLVGLDITVEQLYPKLWSDWRWEG